MRKSSNIWQTNWGFHKWGYPLYWKIPLKWMIYGDPNFRTPPNMGIMGKTIAAGGFIMGKS